MKIRTAGIILLVITALLVTLCVVPASASGDNGNSNNQFITLKDPSDTPLIIGGGWTMFFWGEGEPVFSDSGSFTFENSRRVRVRLDVTDAFLKGDRFRIYDNGIPIGETSSVPAGGGGEDDPNKAFMDPAYSSGSFFPGYGSHSITIEVIDNPFDGGGAFIRVVSLAQVVGGELSPVNKSGLILPWITLAILPAAGGIYLVRRRVRN